MKYNVYRIHGLCLPEGTYVLSPQNIAIGDDFGISPFCQLICQDSENGSRLVIGDHVSLNFQVSINADCGGRIYIGNKVIIGPMTVIRASNHRFESIQTAIRDQGHEPGRITIEDDVWVGAGVIILPNVVIGTSSIIGAGSVVTRDIPPYSIAVGSPAKVIRSRRQSKKVNSVETNI